MVTKQNWSSSRLITSIIFLTLTITFAEDTIPCYDGPFDNGETYTDFDFQPNNIQLSFFAVLLDGCVDDCKSFETLAEAEEHCTSLELCGGITKSAYGDQEAINLGVGLYEVRQVTGNHSL
jgi:hypothetical protein